MKTMPNKLIIFTDLDGTLLDHETYSFSDALPALALLKSKDIPLVFCTSKTRAEVEALRLRLGNTHPFIVENGGAIYIPLNYFSHSFEYSRQTEDYAGDYKVIKLGAPYSELVAALNKIKEDTGVRIEGFSDMSVDEIREATGLSEAGAILAAKREFDEPFLIPDGNSEETVISAISKMGFQHTAGGRLHHILRGSDKGRAVEILIKAYRKESGDVVSVGLGDSYNDLPMLKAVDISALVRKPDGKADDRIKLANFIVTEGIGPVGWNETVTKIVNEREGD